MKVIKSEVIEIGKLYTDVEVVQIIKDSITTDILKTMRMHGNGIPYVKLGMMVVRYRIEDVRGWIDENFPR